MPSTSLPAPLSASQPAAEESDAKRKITSFFPIPIFVGPASHSGPESGKCQLAICPDTKIQQKKRGIIESNCFGKH